MKITLTDDLGNSHELSEKASLMVGCSTILINYFIPCEVCNKVILLTKVKTKNHTHMCANCYKEKS